LSRIIGTRTLSNQKVGRHYSDIHTAMPLRI